MNEDFLHRKLNERRTQGSFRELRLPAGGVDFCSNDYLGIVHMGLLNHSAGGLAPGSTGSRLLAGNYSLIEQTERLIADFHQAPAGLIYNSGYDANLGLICSVAGRGHSIIFDSLCHASIRDGIRLSFAQAYSFEHNNLADLQSQLMRASGEKFVVTESVFSMDGDQAPLADIQELCENSGAHLIVDEAHGTGILGPSGAGLVQQLGLQDRCFARIHTFGKALGCHGAIVLGSTTLRDYLINFSRPFIYSTALPPASIAAIRKAYEVFPAMESERGHLQELVDCFQHSSPGWEPKASRTPIQLLVIPGNEAVKAVARQLQQEGLDLRPILYPTVPKGSERLRIVLHAYNTTQELDRLIGSLQKIAGLSAEGRPG